MNCHTVGKLTNGPIAHIYGEGYNSKSLYLRGWIVSCTHLGGKKSFTCASVRQMRHQPWQFNKFSTRSDTTGWWFLLRHLICSTAHISTTLGNTPKYIGVRDKVHASSPPNPPGTVFLCSQFPIFISTGNVLPVDSREHVLSERVPPSLPVILI